MYLSYSNATNKRNRALLLVFLAAVGAIAFIFAGSLLVYSSARQLIASRDWEDHSSEVLNTLQITSQRLDRIDAGLRIYQLTRGEGDLRTAQSMALLLESSAAHLRELVRDNQQQSDRAAKIDQAAQTLARALERMGPDAPVPSHELALCRQVTVQMQEEERVLLNARALESREHTYRSVVTGVVYVLFSLAVVLLLFGSLLRDILRRKQFEEKLSQANSQLELTIGQLEFQARETALLTAARDEMQICVSAAEAHTCAARYCERLLKGTRGAVLIINNSRQMVELRALWGEPATLIDNFALDACCGLRTGRTRWRKEGESEVHCSHFTGAAPANYLCVPLAAQGDTLGFVYVECPDRTTTVMVQGHERPLQELIETASMAIASLNLRARLENQSIRDGMTNLFNRHFMEIALDRELRRAARSESSLAVIMLDVDHFKSFNDTYGHEAGDNILREVAETFRLCVRSEDVICRYGGEEFVIILPDTDGDSAFERAEAIRRRVGEIRVRHRGESLREVTISAGVAMFPRDAEVLEEILRAADRALYEAKHRGRNRVVQSESKATV